MRASASRALNLRPRRISRSSAASASERRWSSSVIGQPSAGCIAAIVRRVAHRRNGPACRRQASSLGQAGSTPRTARARRRGRRRPFRGGGDLRPEEARREIDSGEILDFG
jgi:hypothetical protein